MNIAVRITLLSMLLGLPVKSLGSGIDVSASLLKKMISILQGESSRLAEPLQTGNINTLLSFADMPEATTSFVAHLGLGLLYHGLNGAAQDAHAAKAWLEHALRLNSDIDYTWSFLTPYILYLMGTLYFEHDSFVDNDDNWRGFELYQLTHAEIRKIGLRPHDRRPSEAVIQDYDHIAKSMLSTARLHCLQWKNLLMSDEERCKDPSWSYRLLLIGLLLNDPHMLTFALRHGQPEAAYRLGNLTLNSDIYWLLDLRATLHETRGNEADLIEGLGEFGFVSRDPTQIYLTYHSAPSDHESSEEEEHAPAEPESPRHMMVRQNSSIVVNPAVSINHSLGDTLAKLATMLGTDTSNIDKLAAGIRQRICTNALKAKAYYHHCVDLCKNQLTQLSETDDPEAHYIDQVLQAFRRENLLHWKEQSNRKLMMLTLIYVAADTEQWDIITQLSTLYEQYLSPEGQSVFMDGSTQPALYQQALENLAKEKTGFTLEELYEAQHEIATGGGGSSS